MELFGVQAEKVDPDFRKCATYLVLFRLLRSFTTN
jgi:hypothetical protein